MKLSQVAKKGTRLASPRLQKKLIAMVKHRPGFFNDHSPRLPEGFVYREDLLTRDEDRALVNFLKDLPFREFEYQGFVRKLKTAGRTE